MAPLLPEDQEATRVEMDERDRRTGGNAQSGMAWQGELGIALSRINFAALESGNQL